MDSSDYHMDELVSDENHWEIDQVAKELEHALRWNTMDRELNELNKRLEQKASEMKLVGGADIEAHAIPSSASHHCQQLFCGLVCRIREP